VLGSKATLSPYGWPVIQHGSPATWINMVQTWNSSSNEGCIKPKHKFDNCISSDHCVDYRIIGNGSIRPQMNISTSKKCFMGYCPDLWQFCPLLCPICPQFFIFAANWWHTYNFYASTNLFGFILGQITCMFAHQNGLNRAYRANQFSHP
jgi:hypothetical protein